MSFKLQEYIEPDFNKDCFVNAPDALLCPCPRDMAAPDNYHATSIFPEYFKISGKWLLAEESRMDCLPVYEDGKIHIREFRNLVKGDLVVTGRSEDCEEGIYVHSHCFHQEAYDVDKSFSFRQGRTRETGFSCDYDFLYELMEHEKKNGNILWVLGPACAFDQEARLAFSQLISNGYVDALLAGNALATHDLEAGYLGTALGADIYNQRHHYNGHYNHIDTINKVNQHGSIKEFIQKENIKDGIIYSCVKNNIPFVLNGSIRDDGPLPEVLEHTYIGQDTMRKHIRKATTVIGMATTLHTIATGNMTPVFRVMADGTKRPIYFYIVDTAEFAVNKLSDRGSLGSKGIVTNVQDFVINLCKGLCPK
ncbi:MAG: hypothetical protein GX578_04810 [Clostridiales bacterium]|nr:hypothetical protein [Clostridiales bacterium]